MPFLIRIFSGQCISLLLQLIPRFSFPVLTTSLSTCVGLHPLRNKSILIKVGLTIHLNIQYIQKRQFHQEQFSNLCCPKEVSNKALHWEIGTHKNITLSTCLNWCALLDIYNYEFQDTRSYQHQGFVIWFGLGFGPPACDKNMGGQLQLMLC